MEAKSRLSLLVPDALVESGFKPADWVRDSQKGCGGRGGVKAASAQGQAPECSDLSSVVTTANAFKESKVVVVS